MLSDQDNCIGAPSDERENQATLNIKRNLQVRLSANKHSLFPTNQQEDIREYKENSVIVVDPQNSYFNSCRKQDGLIQLYMCSHMHSCLLKPCSCPNNRYEWGEFVWLWVREFDFDHMRQILSWARISMQLESFSS